MSNVVVKDLVKVYKLGHVEVLALRGLNCTIGEGEILAVMGPSGCGKTTLLNILGGIDRPTAGSIEIFGANIATFNDRQLVTHRQESVGIVFQFFNLIPTLTARENVELPMRIAGNDNPRELARADELLALVGMEHRANHKPGELSGGEQQRVGIAVALANDPPIILADEPTGELDSEGAQRVFHLFRDLRDQLRKTIVIVTHDSRAEVVADRVVRMVDGRIDGE